MIPIEDMDLAELNVRLTAVKQKIKDSIPDGYGFALILCTIDTEAATPVFCSTLGEHTTFMMEHVIRCTREGKYIETGERPETDD